MDIISSLFAQKDQATILAELKAYLDQYATPVDDWEPGGVVRTIMEIDALALSDYAAYAGNIARSGFVDTAQGAWLDALAGSFYNISRKSARAARYSLTLADTAGAGPYNLQPGDLIASSVSGLELTLDVPVNVPVNGSVAATFTAQQPGAAYNLPAGSYTVLKTPLPGLTVAQPQGAQVTAGADAETDAALRTRLKASWGALGAGGTRDRYIFLALGADPAITKVRVLDDHPRGQGTVDVIIAGNGPLPQSALDNARAAVLPFVPLTADVAVDSAVSRDITVAATASVQASYRVSAAAQHVTDFGLLEQDGDIGGTVYLAKLIDVLMNPTGVINAVVTQPQTDIPLGPREVPRYALNLQYTEV